MSIEYDLYYMKRVYNHDCDDARWLRWMDAICFPEYEPFEFDGAEWYLLEYDGKYVGYSAWRKVTEDTVELCRAGVLPKSRGNGFQTYMIKFREREAKRMGYTFAVTTTHQNNSVSINNLIKAGYKAAPKEDYPSVQSDKSGAVYWKRKL